MTGLSTPRDRILQFTKERYGQEIYDLFLNRLKEHPEQELHIVLNELLRQQLGGSVPKDFGNIPFNSD